MNLWVANSALVHLLVILTPLQRTNKLHARCSLFSLDTIVSPAEPRIVVDSTTPLTLEGVEDYAAVSGDCIVQVAEVRLRIHTRFRPRVFQSVLLLLQGSPHG